MGTVRYTVIDGEVVSELRGGVKRDYVPDPLGSTVALLDSTQTITDTFQYWPYGEISDSSGSTPLNFKFIGSLGYYVSGDKIYIRSRYLSPGSSAWITEDSLFDVNLFVYCNANPVNYVDPTGNICEKPGPCDFIEQCSCNEKCMMNGWNDISQTKCTCVNATKIFGPKTIIAKCTCGGKRICINQGEALGPGIYDKTCFYNCGLHGKIVKAHIIPRKQKCPNFFKQLGLNDLGEYMDVLPEEPFPVNWPEFRSLPKPNPGSNPVPLPPIGGMIPIPIPRPRRPMIPIRGR